MPDTMPMHVPTQAEPERRVTKDQQLLAECERPFRRFMYYPHEHAFTVATLLVAHTHLRDADGNFLPRITPRGYTGSHYRNCGKTTDLELKITMSYNGTLELEPTDPGVTSMIHNDKATVGLTEIDLLFGNRGGARSGLRAIINGGYKRGATRSRERNGETDHLNVHGPLFLDGKNLRRFLQEDGPFDTVRSRSIVTALERKPDSVALEAYDADVHESRLRQVRARLTRWGQQHGKRIVAIDVKSWMWNAGLRNRDAEIWTVLFQVAAHVGGEWPARIEAAAKALALGQWGDDETPVLSPAQELLRAAQACFTDGETFLPVSALVGRLVMVDGWWQQEWANPRAAAMSLAAELGTFGVEGTRSYVDGRQVRGYALVDLLDVEADDDWADEPADAGSWDVDALAELDD